MPSPKLERDHKSCSDWRRSQTAALPVDAHDDARDDAHDADALPVDAHQKVREETLVETQLPAFLHVGKAKEETQDYQNDKLMINIIHIHVCY